MCSLARTKKGLKNKKTKEKKAVWVNNMMSSLTQETDMLRQK